MPLYEENQPLSERRIEAFAAELDAIRARAVADLGERDAGYIRRMIRLQRSAELAGRVLLFLPPAWLPGTALLALSKVLENMEIGHNVMHGQYDWTNDPSLNGARYEWDSACPADHWRHSHNHVHHTFTNVVGKDRDIGYGLLRMTDQQPWRPWYLAQPVSALGLMLFFEWGVAVHGLELDRLLAGEKAISAVVAESRPILVKALRQKLKDYVLFPLLAGPLAPFVWSGNASANTVRDIWAFLVIFCGHFPEGVEVFHPSTPAGQGETRGDFYLRQIRGSANVEGSALFHVLSGHLSHQIEHHLFPGLPAHRYPEIGEQVRAVCREYGVRYNTGSFARQIGTVARRILRHSLPVRRFRRAPRPAPAVSGPASLFSPPAAS